MLGCNPAYHISDTVAMRNAVDDMYLSWTVPILLVYSCWGRDTQLQSRGVRNGRR